MRTALMIATVLLLAHCGDDDGSDAAMDAATDVPIDTRLPDTARIEIGTGLTEFIEVADGGDAELVAGPQGGWHVNVALRLYDLVPEGLFLRIIGTDVDSGEALAIPIERVLTMRRVRREGDHFLRLGDQLIMAITMPSEAAGRDVRVSVVGQPDAGGEVMAEHVFHIVDEIDE